MTERGGVGRWEGKYVYMSLIHLVVAETITTLQRNYTPIKNELDKYTQRHTKLWFCGHTIFMQNNYFYYSDITILKIKISLIFKIICGLSKIQYS